jgi:hypothetical protein
VITERLLTNEHASEFVSSLDVDRCEVHMTWQKVMQVSRHETATESQAANNAS